MKIFSLVVILGIALYACVVKGSNLFGWDDLVNKDDPLNVLKKLIPAGDEGIASRLYVCRARRDNKWIPGKLLLSPYTFKYFCGISANAEYHYYLSNSTNIQVLVYPEGWTNWVAVTNRWRVPMNAIDGGRNPDGETAQLCRHEDKDGRINLGRYSVKHGHCTYAFCETKY